MREGEANQSPCLFGNLHILRYGEPEQIKQNIRRLLTADHQQIVRILLMMGLG